jgi:homotetrameric cytidine deaminase
MADWINNLIMVAEQARLKAYAPYSQIMVGVALLSASGTIFTGANIENASYPAGICAECAAFTHAILAGERQFTALAVIGGPMEGVATGYFYPCGICRQWMAEFCSPDFIVLVAKSVDEYQKLSLSQLLPHSFGPTNLQ